MTAVRVSDIVVCANCCISKGHHKYFPDAGSAEGYFRGKAIFSQADNSIVYENPSNRFVFERGVVHLPNSLSDLQNADYICYKNAKSQVFFINKITAIEPVNDNSSRVHFEIDYYATYVGYVKFGWCFVLRQHPEQDILGDYLINEPIDAPTVPADCQFADLEAAMEQYWKSCCYVTVSTCDENGLTTTNTVQAHYYQGNPVIGSVKIHHGGAQEVCEWLVKYLNNAWTSTALNQVSRLTALEKIMYCPSDCATPNDGSIGGMVGSAVPFHDPNPPQYKWSKMYSPQFYWFSITAQTSGQSLRLDLYKQNSIDPQGGHNTNAQGKNRVGATQLEWNLNLFMAGIPYPQAGLGIYYWGNTVSPSPDELIVQNCYPDIDLNAQYNHPMTGAGALLQLTGLIGVKQAADPGSAISDIFANISKSSTPTSKTTLAAPNNAMSMGYFGYHFNTTRFTLTKEGEEIVRQFFDSYGYQMNRRMQLKLMTRANFTYTQIGKGATFTSTQAPQVAIDAIRDMLEEGLTVWQADIGSTEDCG